MITIHVINESTVVTDAQVADCVEALLIQLNTGFRGTWTIGPVELSMGVKDEVATPGVWQLIIADNSDQAGALGYHELTNNDDPIGFVFAADDIKFGTSWTVTASHELLEMLVDPAINLVVEVDNPDGSYTFYAREVCDACEDDSYGYGITIPSGTVIKVSDFVRPDWFDPSTPHGYATDFQKHLRHPFELLPGGYIGVLNVAAGPQWTQVTAQDTKGKTAMQVLPGPLSRRYRRALNRNEWKRSTR